MRKLPIIIEIREKIDERNSQLLYGYPLEINYLFQGDVLRILDEKIAELVKDFDLSNYEDLERQR